MNNSDHESVAVHEAVDRGGGCEDDNGRGHHFQEEHLPTAALFGEEILDLK